MKFLYFIIVAFFLAQSLGMLIAQESEKKDSIKTSIDTMYISTSLPVILQTIRAEDEAGDNILLMRFSDLNGKEFQVIAETTADYRSFNFSNDINFDGYTDIEWEISSQQGRSFRLFDGDLKRFADEDLDFGDCEINESKREITETWHTGGGSYGSNTYKAIEGKILLVKTEESGLYYSSVKELVGDSMLITSSSTPHDTIVDGVKSIAVLFEERMNGILTPERTMYAIKLDELNYDTLEQDGKYNCSEDFSGQVCWYKQEIYTFGEDEQGSFIKTDYQIPYHNATSENNKKEALESGSSWVTTNTTKKYTDKLK